MPAELVYRLHGQLARFPLTGDEVTIGRDAGNDLVIEHRSVSRLHAKLQREGAAWRVVDLGSRYGTRVNDLDNDNTLLRSGDTILLHRFPLTFVDGDVGAALTTATEHTTNTVFHDTVDFSSLVATPPDVRRLQKLLSVVTEASRIILVGRSLEQTFEDVLGLIFQHLPVERGFVMVWDEERGDLIARCTRHRDSSGTGSEPIRFPRTIAEKVYRDKVSVITTDAQADERFAAGESIMTLGIRSAMAAPLWNADKVDGLIYVDSTVHRHAFDSFDLDILSALGNHLAVAIEQSRLQDSVVEQQVARRRLERYHSPAVVQRITENRGSGDEGLMVEEREVSVLFADVVEFTRRCESMEPRAVAELLNRYFSVMTEIIFQHEGTLDKYIGDCLMAVFGAPIESADHARRAVDAALEMRDALDLLNEPRAAADRVEFRVGIHSGRVVAGDIGSILRSDYTVLGATVNLAARLESAVATAGQIVISDVTLGGLGGGYSTRCLGQRRPKGVSRPVECHEVLGRGTVDPQPSSST